VGKITERDMRNNSEKYKKQLIAMWEATEKVVGSNWRMNRK
jgi:hypothetical protein